MNSLIKSYLLVSLIAIALFNSAEAQSDKAKKPSKTTKVVKTVPVKYTVNGRIEDMPNHFVVLNEFVANSLKVIDSCYTDTAGKFIFKGTIENEKIMYLQYSKNGFIPLVITKDMNTNLLILPYTTGLNYELSGIGFEKSHEIKNFLVNQTQYSKAVGDIEGVFNSGAELSEDQKYALEQQYYQARDVSTNHIKESILNSKSGLTSYFILLNFVEEPEFPEIEAIYKKLLVENPNSAYFKEIKLKYDVEAPTAIGSMAPDISMVSPDG
ncbi:MAG: DUF4369 domain-containing protein, partial [Bacteroidia bacterium]|nr:DUF4369 domain-containing protein [Bacteroidia bacterium]